ncbi:hypothetical protein ASZ90_006394 [hydrocarbon metagenome]|uniref:Uncharacterized protein n=1 Tax=hydrocarbon metagenome TaxID=938273 RepID=A0A0W8FSF3_9ZZZZ
MLRRKSRCPNSSLADDIDGCCRAAFCPVKTNRHFSRRNYVIIACIDCT